MTSPSLHPAIDNGIQAGSKDFAGGYLHCHCDDKPVPDYCDFSKCS